MPLSTTDSINGNAVSTTSYTYFSKLVNSKRYIVSDSVVSQDLINNIKTVSNYYDYDEFLIPERMKTRSYSGTVLEAETIDSLEYYHDTSKWLLGQLLDKTTVQSRPGETDYTRKYEHTYYPNGSLRESYKERGTGNEIKTTFTYDTFGNVTSTSVTAGGSTRASSMTYTADGRFPDTKTDALGNTESYNYNTVTGCSQAWKTLTI